MRVAMEKAGFVDIKEINMKIPISRWEKDPKQKELGQFSKLGFLRDPKGYMLLLAHALGWTKSQIEVFLAHLRKELRDLKCVRITIRELFGAGSRGLRVRRN